MSFALKLDILILQASFRCISERKKMIIYNTISVAFPGCVFAVIGFIPAIHPIIVVLLFIGMSMCFAFTPGAIYKVSFIVGKINFKEHRLKISLVYSVLLSILGLPIIDLLKKEFSRQYNHFVVANIQFVKCISLFIGPMLMTAFVRDETKQEQWRKIFLIFALVLISVSFLKHSLIVDKISV